MSDDFFQVCCTKIFVGCKVVTSKYDTCSVVKNAIMFNLDCYRIACFGIAAVYRIITFNSQAYNVNWVISYHSNASGNIFSKISCYIRVCCVCIDDIRAYTASIKGTSYARTVRGRISWTAICCNSARNDRILSAYIYSMI